MKMGSEACLLIHGFDGGPRELVSLHEILEKAGYDVYAPVLAGHQKSRKELASSRYADWIESAMQVYRTLEKDYRRVVLIGFSMGGLIAAQLAVQSPPALLILGAAPAYFWNIPVILRNIQGNFRESLRTYWYQSRSKPLRALLEFLKVRRKTRPVFSEIYCPALVLQNLDDDTVPLKSAYRILSQLSGATKLLVYPRGGHLLFAGPEADAVCRDVVQWLKDNQEYHKEADSNGKFHSGENRD